MASWVSLLLLLLLLLICKSVSQAEGENNNIPILEFTSETTINNVVQDPQTGRIYLGAVNSIFQLGPSLQMQARAETGPKEDARACTPPASACQDTKLMPNVNKLLLVHPSNGSLIVCGSRYRGICSLLNLTDVEQQLYYSDSKGERTYVASIEDNVNVVGVMSNFSKDGETFSVFLVGKGYGSLDSMKLISTRILQDYRDWVVFESIIETSTVQTIPFVPKFLHDFRLAFKEDGFVYFLFSRTLDGSDNKNLTFVSRLCEEDQHYYSHTELQLSCGEDNRYNKVQAGYVATPGKELARAMSESGSLGMPESKFLFVVASSEEDERDSALCMYSLRSINQRLVDIISACYSDSGMISDEPAVDMPYFFKTAFCTSNIAKDTLKNFKCGADFLPSPLASKPRFALKAKAQLTRPGLLTAVAVAVENDHTVAFLGNDQGGILKVHLTAEPSVYSETAGVSVGGKVNRNLFFDLSHSHIYITTEKTVTINIPSLPAIGLSDRLHCTIASHRSEGKISDSGQVSCDLPKPSLIPQTPGDQDFVAVEIKLFVNESVELAAREFNFYSCAATVRKSENTPCMACVASSWGCQWNTDDHTCSDMDKTSGPNIIKQRQGLKCPKFENPDPGLIPVGYKTRIGFEGMNLERYQGRSFTIGTELMKSVEEEFSYDKSPETNVLFYMKDKESGKKMDSTLNVTLYNCSVGRQDCSLCKSADMTYRCVWCAKQNACVYEKLCNPEQQGVDDPYNTECPNPQITDIIPRFGPMRGEISITILGSNLGIHRDDIKSITVAGEPCTHHAEKYSVSTSIVCEIGPINPSSQHWGQVEVEVKGEKRGMSFINFTYRLQLHSDLQENPPREPTLSYVLVSTVKALALTSPAGQENTEERSCPLTPSRSTVKYGKSTTTTIPNVFQFVENPIVLGHNPKESFVCGGRNIVVTGSGFDFIQTAVMKVHGNNMTAVEVAHEKNDTVIQFRSPTVNSSLNQHVRTYIQLDNWVKELKPFDYYSDPIFYDLVKNVITEASIIIVTVSLGSFCLFKVK
ncbi:unnamed protein product [Tetraodon nigroviridis]|uniref:(spotted green pufferfish) hypothetical protein n=1 Tax=Tetraodon nigroviridis TaxID=99883 RepID=Q4RSJ5_TETNG|nr:unnamed protein product [Tetraodon nigroviridis]